MARHRINAIRIDTVRGLPSSRPRPRSFVVDTQRGAEERRERAYGFGAVRGLVTMLRCESTRNSVIIRSQMIQQWRRSSIFHSLEVRASANRSVRPVIPRPSPSHPSLISQGILPFRPRSRMTAEKCRNAGTSYCISHIGMN